MKKIRFAAPLAAAIAMLVAACGRSSSAAMDDGLKQDLAKVGGSSIELAPTSVTSQMVVSAIEGGPATAPARASTRKATAPKPVARPEKPTQNTVAQLPAVAPTPAPTIPPTPVEASAAEPPPLPPASAPVTRQQSRRQTGPYKTEAEIFRQMPWIRP